MTKKIRGKGEGTIYKRHNGTWRAQISIQGRRLSHTAKTRQEVQHWLDKTRRQIEDGMTYANSMITLNEHLGSWLISSRYSKFPITLRHYKSLIRMYVKPHIGHIKLKDLTPDQIQGFYNNLVKQCVEDWTVINIHTMLHSALAHAVRTGIINRNHASHTMAPKDPTMEIRYLDDSQLSQLLIASSDTYSEDLFYLVMMTGMRKMEHPGLKWSDLDWGNLTLKVVR